MEERLSYRLKRTQHALRTRSDRALAPIGVTTPQYVALATLDDTPRLSAADLARRCFVTQQTMNAMVLDLERRGLLARRAHPAHARILETTLTPRGTALLRRARTRVLAIDDRMTAGLSPSERTQLGELLDRCAEALDDSEAATSVA